MGYAMPDLEHARPAGLHELVKNPSAPDDSQRLSVASPRVDTSPMRVDSVSNQPSQHEGMGSLDPGADFNRQMNEPGGLIRDTAGRKYFIGPSGSLQFLGQLRRLILSSRTDAYSDRHTSSRLNDTLTEDDAAQALEADGNREDPPALSSALNGSGPGESPQFDAQSHVSLGSSLIREFTSISNNEIEDIRRQLPSQSTVDTLVRVYFRDVHPEFSLFHRGTFTEDYETYMSTTNSSQKTTRTGAHLPSAGWLGCLHMAIAFASMSNANDLPSKIDLASLSRHCVSLTRQLLPHLVAKCALANVQALLLLALFLHNHNERNAAWNLVGTAKHMAFSLGLHRDTDNQAHFRPMERESRKRVFCTLYIFEQFLASSLGRPTGLYEFEDVEIVPPHEALLDGGDDEDDTMRLSLELQGILAQARVSLAVKTMPVVSGQSNSETVARHEQSSRETLEALNKWRISLETHHTLNIPTISEANDTICQGAQDAPQMSLKELKTMMGWQSRRRLRAALVLQLQYRYTGVLVTRSTLLLHIASARGDRTGQAETARDNRPSNMEEPLSDLCVTHAVQLCRLILLADSVGLVNGTSAMDIFYAYCGVMVLILRSLRISLSASDRHDSHERQLQIELCRLIAETREVLMRVKKSSTMTRFARVVAAFEEGLIQDQSHPAATVGDQSLGDDNPTSEPGNLRAPPGSQTLTNPMYSTGQFNTPTVAGAELLSDTSPHFAPQLPGRSTAIGPGLFEISDSSWQPNSLTTFDGQPDVNSWMMDSFPGLDGAGVVDWDDIETLLARNIGQ
ncbi:hypothetical protein N7456_002391 [Penicillium angulare]|uniref:Xylanolytic transcriptional activator regulatory domain-containing protein n=1 Tax=Penicillium angulare TaxID=116970 RepID=A0A9W9G9C4_9EURO|nr:hypothetical protein N7456_002391 [Penicillium angulare]